MIGTDLQPYDRLIPPGTDSYRTQWRDQVSLPRVQEAIHQIASEHPGPAPALQVIAAMRYAHIR
jgi:hypothetical protein